MRAPLLSRLLDGVTGGIEYCPPDTGIDALDAQGLVREVVDMWERVTASVTMSRLPRMS